MKIETLLFTITDVLMGVKVGGRRNDARLAQLDRGILDIALMIAALDGTILPAEVAAYYRLLGKSRGCAKKDAPTVLNAALRKAGYLIALRQTGTDEKTLLSAFVEEATASLPVGFANGSMADLRRAFVFWMTMSLSDGTYAPIETKALDALTEGFARIRCPNKGKKDTTISLLEEGFLAKAEKLIRDLAVESRRAQAQAELDALIMTVTIPEGAKQSVTKKSSGVSVRAGVIALLVLAGMCGSAFAEDALPFGAELFGFCP